MRSLVLEHPTEVAVKLEEDFEQLKKFSRTLIVCILNCTNAPIEMTHSKMVTGVHKKSTSTAIAPQKYAHFTFHNSMFTGLSGNLHFSHPTQHFRISFENPLVGKCKGFVE